MSDGGGQMSGAGEVAVSRQARVEFSPWPYGIMIFFVLLFAGGIALYLVAVSGPSKWLEGNPYEDGMRYQQVIEQEQRFLALGWLAQTETSSDGALVVSLSAPDNQPVTGRALSVYLMRPGDSTLDRRLVMTEDSSLNGRYFDPHHIPLASGLWIVDLQILTDQGMARSRARFVR